MPQAKRSTTTAPKAEAKPEVEPETAPEVVIPDEEPDLNPADKAETQTDIQPLGEDHVEAEVVNWGLCPVCEGGTANGRCGFCGYDEARRTEPIDRAAA